MNEVGSRPLILPCRREAEVQAEPMTPEGAEPSWRGGFLISEEPVPWGKLIVAGGELDLTSSSALRETLAEVVDSGAERVVLDFTEVSFIDSLALASVVAAKRRMGPGARLAVVASNQYVLLILEAGGLDSVFEVFRTRDDAVEHVLS